MPDTDRPVPDTARAPVAPAPAAPIERAALERVLARAAELQHGGGDAEGGLSEAQLVEIGREVGIAPEHLRQALAEERTRVVVADEPGLAARLAGPGTATASRVVAGTPDALLTALDGWMQREECLQVKRRFAGRTTWESRRDFMGQLRRGLRVGGRGYDLTRAYEVAATVSAVDDRRSLVRLDADLVPVRTARLWGGAASAAGGTMAGVGVAVAGAVANAAAIAIVPLAIVPVAIGLAGGVAVARGHLAQATRAQLALEQVLDRLEHGDARRAPTVFDVVSTIARRIR